MPTNTPHVTIIVNVPRQPTEAEQRMDFWLSVSDQIWRGIQNRVRNEKAAGTPEFMALPDNWTHAQFMEAADKCDTRKRKEERKRLGFWKYYFGDSSHAD